MALEDVRIVLVEPAHPGNIGAAARAMKAMSLKQLWLVRPRVFPAEEADRRAMGAIDLLQQARVVDDLMSAIGDCRLVVGGSARSRSFPQAILDARDCAVKVVAEANHGEPVALVFGPERTGLSNQDLDRCSFQFMIPTSDAFSSLNLASAVQLMAYELFLAGQASLPASSIPEDDRPGFQREMEYFYEHLQSALDSRGFLEGEMREVTMTKLRRLFGRARPSAGELKLLRTLTRMIHADEPPQGIGE